MSIATASSDWHHEWTSEAIIIYPHLHYTITSQLSRAAPDHLYDLQRMAWSLLHLLLISCSNISNYWSSGQPWRSAPSAGLCFSLYSRLGLILQNDRIVKGVKWMIIVDAIIFHSLTTIFQAYGGELDAFDQVLYPKITGLYQWKDTGTSEARERSCGNCLQSTFSSS